MKKKQTLQLQKIWIPLSTLVLGVVLGVLFQTYRTSPVSVAPKSKQAETNQNFRSLVDDYNRIVKSHNLLVEHWNELEPKWGVIKDPGATGSFYKIVPEQCLIIYQPPLDPVLHTQPAETCPSE